MKETEEEEEEMKIEQLNKDIVKDTNSTVPHRQKHEETTPTMFPLLTETQRRRRRRKMPSLLLFTEQLPF